MFWNKETKKISGKVKSNMKTWLEGSEADSFKLFI